MEPVWVPEDAVRAIHAELLREHGGLSGATRTGANEAALARPLHLLAYSNAAPSMTRLAAADGFALAKGHCFSDGNKRVALAIVDVFLQLNGLELCASEPDAVVTFRALAAGELTEDDLATWIESNVRPLA